ncbi:ferrous iron transport protein B [Flavobacterium sp. CS20]|uniref:ferrous iron transport protein B n=1 Tax=Flavobacterium sp. CS20 TaxID=2775246 RepID=UPI001B3A0D35|nr:ferrous iron transport protein B [Flavobacterium sp. CS20]QTY28383.1 ferrous iron transport protein B [Flavobacterium sp. CS20]
MMRQINVALVGNPNTGKTSVFNNLTGLNQKVGNYPGITVEKKEGVAKLNRVLKAHIIDLPGTYSLNASSLDENIVIELLLNKNDKDYPDVVVVVSDVENLKRNLLLFTQIKDLGIPTILAINMADRMERKGISLDVPKLEKQLKTKIALISARKKTGFDKLKTLITNYKQLSTEACCNASRVDTEYFGNLKKTFPNQNTYKLWLVITQDVNFGNLDRNQIKNKAKSFEPKSDSELKRLQQKEIIARYTFINDTLKSTMTKDINMAKGLRASLDRLLMHRIWGYLIFAVILLLIFQVIYDWVAYPMDFIDESFAHFSEWTRNTLPEGQFTKLIAEGIIPGIGGIVIFIPQIAFLFFFISILEESGYMSRVVFLTDKIMKKFGLSGKSIVPLVSGTACAIPAVMASRNIENWKERLITILVIPFTTCSARLPVYLIIIALVIPDKSFLGVNYQGLVLLLLYFIGFGMAVFSAWLLHKVMKTSHKTYFVVEMPNYKMPIAKNVLITVLDKTKSFVFGAGKIILAISIILWVLASYGPNEKFKNAENIVKTEVKTENLVLTPEELDTKISSYKLRHSYIGYMGKGIEPVVQPLGYDWKIGIAVISSFARREVFVGTLATIYSVGNENEETIKKRMSKEVNPVFGGKLFNLASGISLLLFYAFAMQCMSTLAVVRRETNTWKWPILQLVFMTSFAYIVSLIAYQILK